MNLENSEQSAESAQSPDKVVNNHVNIAVFLALFFFTADFSHSVA